MLQIGRTIETSECRKIKLEGQILTFLTRVANHFHTPTMPLFRAIHKYHKEFPDELELVDKLEKFMGSYDLVDETISEQITPVVAELNAAVHRQILMSFEFALYTTIERKGIERLTNEEVKSFQDDFAIIKNGYQILTEIWKDSGTKVSTIWKLVEDFRYIEKELQELSEIVNDRRKEPSFYETWAAWEIYRVIWKSYEDGEDFSGVINELHDYVLAHYPLEEEERDEYDYTAEMILLGISTCRLEIRDGKTYFIPPSTVFKIRDAEMR